MQAATDAVCLAYSDDEDYVSFDEAEMDQGIKELYSDDSASDAGSDMSNPDMRFDDLNEDAYVDTLLSGNHNNNNDNDDNDNNSFALFANINENGAPPPPQPQQQQQMQQQQQIQQQQQQQPQSGMFSRLFGSISNSAAAPPSRADEQERRRPNRSHHQPRGSRGRGRGNDSREERNNRNQLNSAPLQAQKIQKATKLQKRLHRLSLLRHKKDAKKKNDARKVIHRQKVNTNVVSINLGTLKENALQVVAGDPIFCKNEKCRTILSMHDTLLDKLAKTNDKANDPKDVTTSKRNLIEEELKVDTDNGEYIWVCQFCNTVNVIEIDDDGEKPKGETLDYVIEPPTESKQSEDDGLIIFCIDVSGSMCVTQEVKGKFALKGDHISSQLNDFSQFIDAGDRLNQFLPNQNRDVTWVSRLQAVQAAVDEQIDAIKKQKPKFKIALVSFANDVVIIGDGISNTKVIAGDKLKDLEKLQDIGRNYSVDNTIDKSFDKLSDALWKLKESGQTALGPALAVSIAMAESKRGSQVILCTDGLANVGVGSLDFTNDDNNKEAAASQAQPQAAAATVATESQANNNDDDDEDDDPEAIQIEAIEQWYENLGIYASTKGVIVNVISITDDGCRLEGLGKLTDACNGSIKRINPLKLTEKFSGILGNEVLATRTQATMYLHPAIRFFSSIEAAEKQDKAKKDKNKADDNIEDLLNLVDMGVEKPLASAATVPPTAAASNEDLTKTSIEKDAKPTTAVVSDSKEDDSNKNDNDKDTADKDNEIRRLIEEVFHSTQDVGNVFGDSEVFFEYIVRKDRIAEFRSLSHLPFQCHIEYEKLDGTKMLRVITQLKPIVFDRKKARENVNVDILAKYGTKVTTELCSKGDYESSRAFTQANTVWMQRNITNNNNNNNLNRNEYRSQMIRLANYTNTNMVLDHHMEKQMVTESIQESHDASTFELADQHSEMMSRILPLSNCNNNNNNRNNGGNVRSMSYNNNSSNGKNKKKSKSKAFSRKSARNDKFSTAMYRMKKK